MFQDTKPMHIYLDNFGLPVTIRGDGGDSAAEAGTLTALDPYRKRLPLDLYLRVFGPVRHPDYDKWYGRPDRFSRDQLIAFMCGLVMSPNYFEEKYDLYLMHKRKRFLFAWNRIRNFVYENPTEHAVRSTPDVKWDPWPKTPDFTGPEVWALWLRMWPRWWKWPLLCVLDLETLASAIHWNWRKGGIARNHLLCLHVATSVMPTPTSWLARALTPVQDLIRRWSQHCQETGAIDTSELFYQAFRR